MMKFVNYSRFAGRIKNEVKVMKSKSDHSIMVLNLEVITPTPNGKASKTWVNVLFSGPIADKWAPKIKEGDAIDLEANLSSRKNPQNGKWENTYFVNHVLAHESAPVAAPKAEAQEVITF